MERLLYATAALAYAAPLCAALLPRLRERLGHVGWWVAGLGLHGAGLVAATVLLQRVPLDSMTWGLAAVSLAVVGTGMAVRGREQLELLGRILLGLAVGLLALSLLGPEEASDRDFKTIWFPVHAALLFAGFALLALSFALSSLFLWVRRRLKLRRLQGIARLPPLETLDRYNFRSLVAGFLALTAGMTVGGMWAATHPGASLGGQDLTVYATLAVWLWYAAGLHLRLFAGWRGHLAAVFSVVGFSALSLVISVAVVVSRSWHGGGT